MFQFKLEPNISLLTVTRTGMWSSDTVILYEAALRRELSRLQLTGGPTAFIVDIRSSGAQTKDVANALRGMVERLGPLNADWTAVVTSSGIAKLQASRVADAKAEIFTSMVLARDWVTAKVDPPSAETVHNEPSDAEAEGLSVRVHGPSDVDVMFTPAAALETAKRIGNAAVEILLEAGAASERDKRVA